MTNPTDASSNTGRCRTIAIFGAASLIAVALGAATLSATGLPLGSWIRNPIAWLVGLVLATGLMLLRTSLPLTRALLVVAFLAVAGTFLAPAQSGVHRWIDLGPLHINVAALLLPAAIVALALSGMSSRTGLIFAAGMAALLVLQPDGSQATSFLDAVIILLALPPSPRRVAAGVSPADPSGVAARVSPADPSGVVAGVSPAEPGAVAAGVPPANPAGRFRLPIAIAAALLLAISWTRPDPLKPVAEVEGIFPLAFSVSPLLAAAAGLALAAASLAPLVLRPTAGAPHRAAVVALTGYFLSAAICPAFGAFPVPLLGLGMSFPVGYWLGIALLCAKGSPIKMGRCLVSPPLPPEINHNRLRQFTSGLRFSATNSRDLPPPGLNTFLY